MYTFWWICKKAKLWHRIAIVSAGAIVNILFAIIVYFILTFVAGYNISTTVSGIIPEAENNISTIQVGDKILEINNQKIRIKSDIAKALRDYNEGEIKVLIERNNEKIEVNLKPTEYMGTYILGVQLTESKVSLQQRFMYSGYETINFVESMITSLKMLFTGNIGIEQMTGPIGISEIVVKTDGIYNFIYLLCLISLSLGVTNLLPIPALDGGRILLLIIEGIRGKALKEEIELGIQSAGFILLIVFSLYVSYKDILRIF